ncbi:hypothetical protein PoB_005402300 [Plakobranchus ocellatus]|uniref:Uncharacterized protein n=1 Tax=Plakobranchus ocellatus TaxID=259542 RepID=A0AAV4C6N3_9GAST|nr:hypothetical protein PoB_005402300 [Plakobranchus ocellatus]
MNSFLQMSSGAGQMSGAFGHHTHHPHYSSNGGSSGGGLGANGSLNPQHAYHHHHHHPHAAHHLGQLYHHPQAPHLHHSRPSFAIQEILGLGCARQGAATPPSPTSLTDAAAAALMAGGDSNTPTSVSSISSSSSMSGLGPGSMYFNPGATPSTTAQGLCGPPESHHHQHHPHQPMQGGSFPTASLSGHHGPHQSVAAGPLYPWRFDLGGNVGPGQALTAPRFHGMPGRHSDDMGFDYKHGIGDDGKYEI